MDARENEVGGGNERSGGLESLGAVTEQSESHTVGGPGRPGADLRAVPDRRPGTHRGRRVLRGLPAGPHDEQHDEQWVETPSAVVAAVRSAAVPSPPGHLRYCINTTRHVWARTQPARGQPWPVRVVGTPGALAISLAATSTPLPPAGTLVGREIEIALKWPFLGRSRGV